MGCQGGCAGCGCVLTLGLIFAIIGGALGISLSARIPGTHSNVTIAGSIGKKELTDNVLPRYGRATFAGNHNFVNYSSTLTIGPAQGRQQIVVGKQKGAPMAGIAIDWKHK
jgi:hypothetical protein